jgi:aminopeptidase N
MDKKEYLYTQFEPYECHLVFPVFDQPDIKAKLSLTLIGPEEWILLSNEYETWNNKLDKTSTEITQLFKSKRLTDDEVSHLVDEVVTKNYNVVPFNTTAKISSYLYAICAGPYYCIKDPNNYKVPLRIFMRESLKNFGEPDEFFRVTIAGMEWYHKFFGIPYPFTKYDQIFTPEYNFGAMENVGLVTYNEAYCWKDKPTQQRRSRFCITVLHELAHMWFGNLVTMKWWDDLWLNESFATFISFLCQSQAVKEEYQTSWLQFNTSKGAAYREDQKNTTHPVIGDITDTDKAQSHFDGIVYYKGSSLLKQMFYFIGEQNFSNGLKEYFKIHAWGNTIFDDFVDQMVLALGDQNTFDLKNLCKHWISEAGLNQVELLWEEESGKITKFNIKQTPVLAEHPNLQTHMMDILFIFDDKKEEHKNILINKHEITELNKFIGKESPKAVILNYNDWAYLKFYIDNKSLAYLKDNLNKTDLDVLTRQLFYRSIYDMTRDATLSCSEYVDIVANLLQHEKNDEIISTTMRVVSGIIAYYMPHKYYSTYASRMFDLTLNLIVQDLSNKEITKNLLELAIVFANTEEHNEILKKWLTSIVINGTEVDSSLLSQDNRFSIVTLIHKSRKIGLEEKNNLLEAEITRDKNSDRSILARNRCKASLPDKAVKEEIWNKIVNEPSSESLYNMKALMSGLVNIDQLDLVEDLVKTRFFEDAKIVAKQEHFYVSAFVDNCAPMLYVQDDIIAKIEKLADEIESNDSMRRALKELADDMRRYAKAQKLSEQYLNKH